MSPEDIDGDGAVDSQGLEPLACVSCRSRKLKCDRTKPACARCTKVSAECVYPESRRKPTFKRRNVKELEERLAQVEGYLKDITKGKPVEISDDTSPETDGDGVMDDLTFNAAPTTPSQPAPNVQANVAFDDFGTTSQELVGLNMTEALPPFELMEELNRIFFAAQYSHIPIIHEGRYYEAFYGSPLRKPPMALQYCIWAMATLDNSKHAHYGDIFYKRARQYLEADEMKGQGEHFITLAHAQAWALMVTYEARRMLFTRACVSCGRAVRLAQMMGLDRLDGGTADLPPALGPTTSWVEREERRRTFWGIFSVDSHASISTGWPNLMNTNDIMTRLPSSEAAFASGQEETTSFLHEVFKGAPYSSFAGTIVTCECFKAILRHVHRPKPNDNPQDIMEGEFWKRHREIDNDLSSIFMFLPDSFRLPQSRGDAPAIYANLNLHAAVICLHHAALDKADEFNLGETIRSASIARLRSSADEIVNIVKMTSHNVHLYRSPLCSLALYCASTVYIYIAKMTPTKVVNPVDSANLEIIIRGMEAISRNHRITQAFLQQTCIDIQGNGLGTTVHIATLKKYGQHLGQFSANIPLVARSHISKHSTVSPVLPGKLPLGNPIGTAFPAEPAYSNQRLPLMSGCSATTPAHPIDVDFYQPMMGAVSRNASAPDEPSHKRKRRNESSTATATAGWTPVSEALKADFFSNGWTMDSTTERFASGITPSNNPIILPDRSTPSSVSSPAHRQPPAVVELSSSSDASGHTPTGLGNTAEENKIDFSAFQDKISGPLWPLEDGVLNPLVEGGGDPWAFLTGESGWNNNA